MTCEHTNTKAAGILAGFCQICDPAGFQAEWQKLQKAQKIVARCVRCYRGFTEEQIAGATRCPFCGNKGVPMSPEEDVELKINWHELRILTIWAENYARQHIDRDPTMMDTVFAIVGRLQDQYPSFAPLTLTGEIRQLKEKHPSIETNIASDEVIDKAPLPPKIS